MSGALLVKRAGPATTVQDLGRWTYQRLGVPVGGALDGTALRLVNALVGNAPTEAGLEFRLVGPDLMADADGVRFAVSGGVEAIIAGEPPVTLAPWRSVALRRGQTLAVRRVTGSAVGYVAVAGGVAVPTVLGSRATYTRAGIGGLEGRVLREGDRLPLLSDSPGGGDHALPAPPRQDDGPLRVVLGPQDAAFTAASRDAFLSETFTVGREADRMGLRLDGPRLAHVKDANIISDGIAAGAIQVPANGQPILLLADRQTVGGYTKIATVISADLPRAGRLMPGAPVRFAAVTADEAVAARRAAEAELAALVRGLVSVPPLGGFDEAALLRENLISGVVGITDDATA
jgi:biotin-dependent carboxylase-like uncharacterized protein